MVYARPVHIHTKLTDATINWLPASNASSSQEVISLYVNLELDRMLTFIVQGYPPNEILEYGSRSTTASGE